LEIILGLLTVVFRNSAKKIAPKLRRISIYGAPYFNLQIFFVKMLQQEAGLREGRAYLLQVNAHSFKHYFNSLRYKKIIFLYY